MISPPPSFIDIKNGFKSSFDFIRKKSNVDNLFQLNNEKNKLCYPMIYMRGLKTQDLQAILEYTYHGEMIICQGIVYEFT